jgi:hypothetical protein
VKNVVNKADIRLMKQDMFLAGRCIDILELCATKDRIARAFYDRLQLIQRILLKCLPILGDNTTEEDILDENYSFNDSYLVMRDAKDTELDLLLGDILQMLCYPFTLRTVNGKGKMPYPTISETFVNGDVNFAHHLASPFNMAEEVVPSNLFPPDDALQVLHQYTKETEGFLSKSVPHGWDGSVWTGDASDC